MQKKQEFKPIKFKTTLKNKKLGEFSEKQERSDTDGNKS